MNARLVPTTLLTVLLTAAVAEAQSPYLQPLPRLTPPDGGFSSPPPTGFANPWPNGGYNGNLPQPAPMPSFVPPPPVYTPPPLTIQPLPVTPPLYGPPPTLRRW